MCKGCVDIRGFYNINHFKQVTRAAGQGDPCEVDTACQRKW